MIHREEITRLRKNLETKIKRFLLEISRKLN